MTDRELIEKLLKIEALYAGAKTDGEKISAFNAKQRILKKIEEYIPIDPPVEYQFSLNNQWSVRLFAALLNRYDIKAYRKPRQRKTTLMANVSVSFVTTVLWPEYLEIQGEVDKYFNEKIDSIVSGFKSSKPK